MHIREKDIIKNFPQIQEFNFLIFCEAYPSRIFRKSGQSNKLMETLRNEINAPTFKDSYVFNRIDQIHNSIPTICTSSFRRATMNKKINDACPQINTPLR